MKVLTEHGWNGSRAAAAMAPVPAPAVAASMDKLLTDKPIMVYCYTGQTAGQTVAGLRLLGYDAVSMHSGMGTPATVPAGWSNKSYPVVK